MTYDEFLNGIRPRTAWVALETCEHAPSTSIDVTQHTSRLYPVCLGHEGHRC